MRAVERQTGETPKALLNRPELREWLVWVYDAFWILDPSRAVYQGSIGRIPLSEMAAYLSVFEVSEIDAKLSFIRMMRALDSVYVSTVNAQIQRKVDQERADAERREERGRR